MIPYAEVIGDPIDQSKSPALHGFWLEALGIEADYRPCRIGRNELAGYLEERRRDPAWRGCNVTAPLKEEILPSLDGLSGEAAAIGAANIVRRHLGRLIGENSDIDGLAEALPAEAVAGSHSAVIGAGGAARAALFHLARSGARRITILARRRSAAEALEKTVPSQCRIEIEGLDAPACLSRAEVIVNASPIGTSNAPLPEPVRQALASNKSGGLLFDMVYQPLETELLTLARQSGLTPVDGLAMLIGQAEAAFRTFYSAAPPRHRDIELRRQLTRARPGEGAARATRRAPVAGPCVHVR